MRVLVGCECSGVVREAFRALGHDAWSCDLLPAVDGSEFHLQSDLLEVIDQPSRMLRHSFGAMIAHPPCDFLTNSAAWAYADPDFGRYPGVGYHQRVKAGTLTGSARREARETAVAFFLALWNCGIERICIENPIGFMNTHPAMAGVRPQIIQPYQFGDDASKATCLWLRGLPHLVPTQYIEPRAVCGVCGFCEKAAVEVRRMMFQKGCPECGAEAAKIRPRWSNQTDSGQNKLSPSEDRASIRAVTYSGIAQAMANQWTF